MIREERLLKVIVAPHVSEKGTLASEKHNTVVFKVCPNATKVEIKAAVEQLFEVAKELKVLISVFSVDGVCIRKQEKSVILF